MSDPAPPPAAPDDRCAVPLATGLLAPAGSDLVLAEWGDPGGATDPPRCIAPLHVHHRDDEAWYVLEGALAFRLGEQTVQAPTGGAVLAPRGTPHTYWNPRPEPARHLLVMTANIRRLIDAIHALPGRDAAAVDAVFRAHESEVLGWP
jgi:mannose-6-phosphate isomerase-like protein (cupin superfamily)